MAQTAHASMPFMSHRWREYGPASANFFREVPQEWMAGDFAKVCCRLDSEDGLSARAHDKILRVARTIADMAASDHSQPGHLQEAINFRLLDRNIFK